MCIAGTLVSWSLTQEVAGWSSFTVMTNIFVTEFSELSETFRENTIVFELVNPDNFLPNLGDINCNFEKIITVLI